MNETEEITKLGESMRAEGIDQSIGQRDANRRNLIHCHRPTTHSIVMQSYHKPRYSLKISWHRFP